MSSPLVSSTVAPVRYTGYSASVDLGGKRAVGAEADEEASASGSSSASSRAEVFSSSEQAAYGQDGKTRAQVIEEQRVIDALQSRDREVRQHERAHQAAGAGHTGAVSYTFQKGPDGRMYAIGGEVGIDTSAVSGDPRATLEKAEVIIRAAMAPADPSPQDYRVAASARAMAADARAELQKMETEKAEPGEEGAETDDSSAESAEDSQSGSVLNQQADAQDGGRSSAANDNGLGSIEQRLIQSGAYNRLYPPGTIFSQQA
ncbi:putative metalloprotease CJM1_0395 family protein [Marinobacterium stanieri]|uniref:SprA-related family protein n=1 Tax=Marinobacterium stanieri TaxID=49186 RepID=A0A1N6NGT3_9GAMM|nr:putative metalloprotease CJM1_0395 family protein [Marinobacterium stanieri]SIP91289.1 SprA-related family protein [Marinobacterium stanieri]